MTRVITGGYRGLANSPNEPLLKPRQQRTLDTAENNSEAAGGTEMTELLRKARATDAIARVAEYVVLTFVAVMTGVSTLRLLGILP